MADPGVGGQRRAEALAVAAAVAMARVPQAVLVVGLRVHQGVARGENVLEDDFARSLRPVGPARVELARVDLVDGGPGARAENSPGLSEVFQV